MDTVANAARYMVSAIEIKLVITSKAYRISFIVSNIYYKKQEMTPVAVRAVVITNNLGPCDATMAIAIPVYGSNA